MAFFEVNQGYYLGFDIMSTSCYNPQEEIDKEMNLIIPDHLWDIFFTHNTIGRNLKFWKRLSIKELSARDSLKESLFYQNQDSNHDELYLWVDESIWEYRDSMSLDIQVTQMGYYNLVIYAPMEILVLLKLSFE